MSYFKINIIKVCSPKFFLGILAANCTLIMGCNKDGNNSTSVSPQNTPNMLSTPKLLPEDTPFFDKVSYGTRPDDSVSDTTEGTAITHHVTKLNGLELKYTASAGHLVTVDRNSSMPNTKIFYVSYTLDEMKTSERPVTFIYNGGPGSSSIWLLLGSFSPKRLKTSMPEFTVVPYIMEDNQESLLDKTDLVFINPIGSGFSTAISPFKNKDFWGVDQDANSMADFIFRYLTKNARWKSPKFLMGESYGTARSAILANILQKNGIELNGISLISSVLGNIDHTSSSNLSGILPTFAANAWYHNKIKVTKPNKLSDYMDEVIKFVKNDLGTNIQTWNKKCDEFINLIRTDQRIREISYKIEMNMDVEKKDGDFQLYLEALHEKLKGTNFENKELLTFLKEVSLPYNTGVKIENYIGVEAKYINKNFCILIREFNSKLIADKENIIGLYDGRAIGLNNMGVISPFNLNSDPSISAIYGAYITAWHVYLNEDLKYTASSSFAITNMVANMSWDYNRVNVPLLVVNGSVGKTRIYPILDLANAMNLNPHLKIYQASGYYDSATPFYQTMLDIEAMPINLSVRKNITLKNYPSGHMIYLDEVSRTAMKQDLAEFYSNAVR